MFRRDRKIDVFLGTDLASCRSGRPKGDGLWMRWGRMAVPGCFCSGCHCDIGFTVSLALKPQVPLIHTYTSEQGELFVYDGMGASWWVVRDLDFISLDLIFVSQLWLSAKTWSWSQHAFCTWPMEAMLAPDLDLDKRIQKEQSKDAEWCRCRHVVRSLDSVDMWAHVLKAHRAVTPQILDAMSQSLVKAKAFCEQFALKCPVAKLQSWRRDRESPRNVQTTCIYDTS